MLALVRDGDYGMLATLWRNGSQVMIGQCVVRLAAVWYCLHMCGAADREQHCSGPLSDRRCTLCCACRRRPLFCKLVASCRYSAERPLAQNASAQPAVTLMPRRQQAAAPAATSMPSWTQLQQPAHSQLQRTRHQAGRGFWRHVHWRSPAGLPGGLKLRPGPPTPRGHTAMQCCSLLQPWAAGTSTFPVRQERGAACKTQ